jgi:hypothetical protein
MRNISFALLVAFACACRAHGRHAPIDVTLGNTDAVAYVQVASVASDLKDGVVSQRAVLAVIGKSAGLKGITSFEVPFGIPSKIGRETIASDTPLFLLGSRCIVLLKAEGHGLRVLRQVYVSKEGKIEEEEVYRTLGFDVGADANVAVDCFEAAIAKTPGKLADPGSTPGASAPASRHT